MSAVVYVDNVRAECSGGEWSCSDPDILAQLNILVEAPSMAQHMWGADPNPDRTLALLAQQYMGAKLIGWDKPENKEDTVY